MVCYDRNKHSQGGSYFKNTVGSTLTYKDGLSLSVNHIPKRSQYAKGRKAVWSKRVQSSLVLVRQAIDVGGWAGIVGGAGWLGGDGASWLAAQHPQTKSDCVSDLTIPG